MPVNNLVVNVNDAKMGEVAKRGKDTKIVAIILDLDYSERGILTIYSRRKDNSSPIKDKRRVFIKELHPKDY